MKATDAKYSVAPELLVRGFNVIIHRHNQAKLQRVCTELLTSHPEHSITIFL